MWQVQPGLYGGGQGLEAFSSQHIQGCVNESFTDPQARAVGTCFIQAPTFCLGYSVLSWDSPCTRDFDILSYDPDVGKSGHRSVKDWLRNWVPPPERKRNCRMSVSVYKSLRAL